MVFLFRLCLFVLGLLPIAAQNQRRWMVKAVDENSSKNSTALELSEDNIKYPRSIIKVTVNDILEGNVDHLTNIIVEGELSYRTESRGYVFTDSTGSIIVEFHKVPEFRMGEELLIGANIRALVVVKKEIWDGFLLEVIRVKLLSPSELINF